MDIVFVKLGALGDVINTLPLAITLKECLHARIHWLVEPLSLPIVRGHPAVYSAIVFDRSKWPGALPAFLAQLRRLEFDIALDLQRTAKSALFCQASRSTRKIGFDKSRCKELTWILPFERIEPADPHRHMVYQYLDFARHLGIEPGPVRWDIPFSGNPPAGIPRDYVVLNVGATKEANRWSARGFASLAEGVMRGRGLPCVLTGSREDVTMARAIASMAPARTVDMVGRTTIAELIEILAGAKAVVTCDTGPMHLAVALGTEVVALMGPSDPRRTGPFKGTVVRLDLPCMPCNKRRCKNPLCMRGIVPEMVMEALDCVLG